MKRVLGLTLVMVLLATVAAVAQTTTSYFTKANINRVSIYQSTTTGSFYVVVTFKTPVNGYNGFYYYEFENLQEAATFADLIRRGRINGFQHYTTATGQWQIIEGTKVYVITRFYLRK